MEHRETIVDPTEPPPKAPRTNTYRSNSTVAESTSTITTTASSSTKKTFLSASTTVTTESYLAPTPPGGSSVPGSPNLSSRRRSRLGKVSRLISLSDANLVKNAKGKRMRNLSGESGERDEEDLAAACIVPGRGILYTTSAVDSGGGDDNASIGGNSSTGSPSKGFLSKATGYVNQLKSRLAKHHQHQSKHHHQRDSSSSKPSVLQHYFHSSSSTQHHHHSTGSFAACCGHTRGIDSSDTLSGLPITSTQEGETIGGSPTVKNGSLSAKGSTKTGASSFDFDLISSQQTVSVLGGEGTSRQSGSGGQMDLSEMSALTTMATGSNNPLNPNSFYTLNVYLLRGKNLVAKDACGSSDPYVKVKIGDKLYHKTKTIYRDLNPFWDESFVLPINDITQPVVFRVFDYDWGFQDDFMGMTSLDPSRLPLQKSQDLSLTLTESNVAGETPMGEIILNVTLVPRSAEEKDVWLDNQSSGKLADSQKRMKSQIWSSVLTVLLIEATNLSPPDDDKLLVDAYVKFRLGNQKYKSRTMARTATPKWLEQFDLYFYEGQPQVLEVQLFDEAFSRDYIGRCSIDIGLLEKETTHTITLPLQEGPGQILLLLTISGTSGAETITDLANYHPSPDGLETVTSRYTLGRSFHNLKDVGHLTVKVYEAQGLVAADIGGKSDPFVVLELVNARLQTQTEYRTLTPCWNKIFTFAVKDFTSVLEVTVFDEDTNHKTEFLGKIQIPLWKIINGEKKWWVLKDRKLIRTAKGNNPQILLELNLIWNPIRAGLRIMDPPEQKFLLPDQRLNREIFLLNIDRLRTICMGIYGVMQYVQSCMEWESPVRSIIALILYQVICYTFQPYMIPLILMLLILKTWFMSTITGTSYPEEYPEEGETLMIDDEDESQGEGEEKKMSLRQKLQAVQDATQTLQNALGSIASFCESTRNLFRMVVPFISWLAVLGLLIGTVVLYLIPMRYLAMAWGLHRFLRPIIRPNHKPTDEIINLLQRIPDNQQLITFKPLRVNPTVEHAVQRNRSPPASKAPHPKKKHKFW